MAKVDSTSKTQKALAWIEEDPTKRTPYAASKKFSVSSSGLYLAIKRREETANRRCPCCGNVIYAPKKGKK